MEKYSVLTTLYDREKPQFLRQSLDSMLEQTVPPSEYVIVEDGPLPDALEQVVQEYAKKYPIFKIVKLEENSGCGRASIAGLFACSYDLVARIDSDDISMNNRCEKELQLFAAEPDLTVVGSDHYEFEEDPDQVLMIKKMPQTPEEIYEYGKRRNPFNHSTVMLRKSIVEQYGGYAPIKKSLDYELFSRLLYNGCKCRNIPEPLVKYRAGRARVIRKKSWISLQCDMQIHTRNFRIGYITLTDYLFVVIRYWIFFLMPRKLAEILFKKLYRQEVDSVQNKA